MIASRALTITRADGRDASVDLFTYLDADAAEQAANEANAWIKSLRTAGVGGASFRDRFTYRGDSLWWFAELYLHRQEVINDLWRMALALDALFAREQPAVVRYPADDRLLGLLVPQAAARHGATAVPAGKRSPRRARLAGAGLKSLVYTWTALASRLRPRDAAARAAIDAAEAAPGGTLVFVHTAFWRDSTPSTSPLSTIEPSALEPSTIRPSTTKPSATTSSASKPSTIDTTAGSHAPALAVEQGEEGYIGAVLRELQQRPDAQPVRLVGVGPRTNFKARRWWHPLVPGRGRRREPVRLGGGAGVERTTREASSVASPSAPGRGGDSGGATTDSTRTVRQDARPSVPAAAGAAGATAAATTTLRVSNTGAAQQVVRESADAAGARSGPRQAWPIVPVESLTTWRDLAGSRRIWRERRRIERALLASDALRQRARLRGYDIWPVVREELRGVARLQFTWSARAMDEASAVMRAYRPARVVTYAEAGGWGRAIMLEARRLGIPSVGLQHGFIYRHWLNYLHLPDEVEVSATNSSDRGFPRPDRTLLYDGYAARHLRTEGRFPAGALAVTGSPGLDALVAAVGRLGDADRQRIRTTLGVAQDTAVGVIVSKHTQIGEALPALARAAAGRADLRLIVKPHPAEVPTLYESGRDKLTVAPPGVDLASLLAVASFVVTVNSTVAIDAITLGLPSLVLLLPNNLSPFVSAGAMLGTTDPAGLPALIDRVLDPAERAAILARAEQFLREGAPDERDLRGDGRAAARAAEAILALGAGPKPV